MSHDSSLEDLLDRLAAEYADAADRGAQPDARDYLNRAPAEARPGLERCLRAMDAASAATPGRAAIPRLGPGTQLGRFEIVREVGRGGMALVFLAKDPKLRRAVALKVLRPGLALEPSHVGRFLREGHSLAKLQHPGVVQVFEVGDTNGYHWIAMEFVEGPTLATIIEALGHLAPRAPRAEDLARIAGAPEIAEAPTFEAACALLLAPALEGLAAAHDAGIIHRDIKPSNLLIHRDGRAVLADFGLARADGDPALSLTGAPIGTPHYMAPEQAEAAERRIDERTDVYGLGATLYELLSQRRPFEGKSVLEVLDAIRRERARPLRSVRKSLSPDAEAVCAKAMDHDPAQRYGGVRELGRDLQALTLGQVTAARKALGGPIRRTLRGLQHLSAAASPEYKSRATLLGWPLLHVAGPPHPGDRMPLAKGWIAVGSRAVGGIAIGGMTLGMISFGGLSAGLMAVGGLAFGGAAVGGSAIGARAFGGLAIGDIAVGGAAIGRGAIGGGALGKYASAGFSTSVKGTYVYIPGDHSENSLRAREFFVGQPEPFGPFYRAIIQRFDSLP